MPRTLDFTGSVAVSFSQTVGPREPAFRATDEALAEILREGLVDTLTKELDGLGFEFSVSAEATATTVPTQTPEEITA